MSIHKAQGQTIRRVKVDLNKVFEKGETQIALRKYALAVSTNAAVL